MMVGKKYCPIDHFCATERQKPFDKAELCTGAKPPPQTPGVSRTRVATLVLLVHAGPSPKALYRPAPALFIKASTHRCPGRLCCMTLLWPPRAPKQLGVNLLEAALPVLELATRLPAHHGYAGGHVAHAHGRVGGVDALAARAGSPKRLRLALASQLRTV